MQPTLCSRCKKRVAVVYISKIENGQINMRVSTLVPLLKALNIKFEQLFDVNTK